MKHIKNLVTAFVLAIAIIASPLVVTQRPAQAGIVGDLFKDVTGTVVAKFLGKKAVGALFSSGVGMLIHASGLNDLIGGPSPELKALEELKEQVKQVSIQIERVQDNIDSLTEDVRTGNLQTLLVALDEKTSNLKDLFKTAFSPMLTAGIAYGKAVEADDADQIDKTFKELIKKRNTFYARYDAYPYGAMPDYIHKFLVPSKGTSASVLEAKGKQILAQKRYLNSDDSAQLRVLYIAFQEQEALAAWMRMERNLPSVEPCPPDPTSCGDEEVWHDVRAEYYEDQVEEHTSLPPLIPEGVVIDAGPTPCNGTDGKTMWTPAEDATVRYQPDFTGPGSADNAIATLNTVGRPAFSDWKVPTRNAVTALLDGYTDKTKYKTANDFLGDLDSDNPRWGAIDKKNWPFLWSSETVNKQVSCLGSSLPFQGKTVVHLGVTTPTATPQWVQRPSFASSAIGPGIGSDVCTNYFNMGFGDPVNWGGVLALARTANSAGVDYMAQGRGAPIRKGASLRNVDLSGRNLTGVDLTGADLTGAIVEGTIFEGADLSNTKLTGINGEIVGMPAELPTGWAVLSNHFVGAGADLRNIDLRNADLSGINLTGVKSGKTDCTGCVLPLGWRWTAGRSGLLVGPGADLTDAEFEGFDLRDIDLTGANLTNADFAEVDLTNATLARTTVKGAKFARATLTNVTSGFVFGLPASLPSPWQVRSGFFLGPRANLKGALLVFADLSFVDLTEANLEDGGLVSAVLQGTKLVRANLRDANLVGANFTSADLTDADLTDALARDASFANATMTRVNLTRVSVDRAVFVTDNDNKLAAIVSGGMTGTPRLMPTSGRYRVAGGYFVGPSSNLEGAVIGSGTQLGVSLSSTNFTNARLTGVSLAGAALHNSFFNGATLTNVNLTGATMINATLTGVASSGLIGNASLPPGWKLVNGYLLGLGAKVPGANLAGVDFTSMDLRGANLRNANLTGAKFENTNLDGADLTGANLTNVTWSGTRCPNGTDTRTTPCSLVIGSRGPTSVALTANDAMTTLTMQVTPSQGGLPWSVVLEQRAVSGGWAPYATYLPAPTLAVNAPAGTYRAVVITQRGYFGSTSGTVTLKG